MAYDLEGLRSILKNALPRLDPLFLSEWTENCVEAVYRHVLQPGDTAVDVGAHRGRHALPMAELVGFDGKVYAIEASSVMAEKLRAAVNHSNVRHARRIVRVTQVAISDRRGTANFTYIPAAAGLSGLKSDDIAASKGGGLTEEVKVERVDDVIPDSERRVTFIKIDVEGAEFPALKGARKTLDRCRPVVSFENTSWTGMKRFNYKAEELFAFIDRVNYDLYTPLGTRFDASWINGLQPGQLFATPREMTNALPTLIAPAMIDAFASTWAQLRGHAKAAE